MERVSARLPDLFIYFYTLHLKGAKKPGLAVLLLLHSSFSIKR